MTDEHGSVAHEGGVAKDVVRMAVGVDDVSDRLVGTGADRRQQPLPLANAASGVDHRNRAVANDESDIGSRTVVLAGHQRGLASMNEYSGRDFAHRQFLLLRLR